MKRSNFLSLVLAVLTACTPMAAAFGADAAPPPVAAEPASAPRPPMIVQNSDGTMTVQMMPAPAQPGAKEGLVIPPQIVVPFTPRR